MHKSKCSNTWTIYATECEKRLCNHLMIIWPWNGTPWFKWLNILWTIRSTLHENIAIKYYWHDHTLIFAIVNVAPLSLLKEAKLELLNILKDVSFFSSFIVLCVIRVKISKNQLFIINLGIFIEVNFYSWLINMSINNMQLKQMAFTFKF